jgi:hypothetical protein
MGKHFNAAEYVALAEKSGKPLADILESEYRGFTSDPDVADEIDWDDIASQCESQAEQ